jgi:transposase
MTLVLIGVDPHKGSHTAFAIDQHESSLGELKVRSSKKQCDLLLDWAARFEQRRWAIESASGLGYLLAQQLVAAGEDGGRRAPDVVGARARARLDDGVQERPA